jgi:hypothetical protein
MLTTAFVGLTFCLTLAASCQSGKLQFRFTFFLKAVSGNVVCQSDLIMTTYFIHTKVKRVNGHESDLSVRCVPGRGVVNEDMG